MLGISSAQSSTLREFFNDIAKGLFLGAVANPAFPSSTSVSVKLMILAAGLILSAFLLSIALYFSNYKENW